MKSCKFILYGFIIQKKISCRQLSENHHIHNPPSFGTSWASSAGPGRGSPFCQRTAPAALWVKCESQRLISHTQSWYSQNCEDVVKNYSRTELSVLYFNASGPKTQILNSKYLHSRDWEKNVTIHPRSTSSSTSALTSAFSSWTHITVMRVGHKPVFDPLYSGRKPYLPNRSQHIYEHSGREKMSLRWSEVK